MTESVDHAEMKWIYPEYIAHGDLTMNLPLLGLLLLVKVGMEPQEERVKKLMLIADAMEPYQSDMIEFGQLMSELETTQPTDTDKIESILTRLQELWTNMFGDSTWDPNANDGVGKYIIDENSDFGRWCKAVSDKHTLLFPKETSWEITNDTSFTANISAFKQFFEGQDATLPIPPTNGDGKPKYINRLGVGLGAILRLMTSEGEQVKFYFSKDSYTWIDPKQAAMFLLEDLARDYQGSQNKTDQDEVMPISTLGQLYSQSSSCQSINSGLGNAMTQLIQQGQTVEKSLGDTGHAMNSSTDRLYSQLVNNQKQQ